MRNSRFVVALAAVACAAALPAAAAAHKGQPQKSQPAQGCHGHPGKGKHGNRQPYASRPLAGQTARGVAELKQHAGALSVALVVST